jgi:hypothetical protein
LFLHSLWLLCKRVKAGTPTRDFEEEEEWGETQQLFRYTYGFSSKWLRPEVLQGTLKKKKKKNDARINGCFFTRSNTTLSRKVQEEEDEDLNRF